MNAVPPPQRARHDTRQAGSPPDLLLSLGSIRRLPSQGRIARRRALIAATKSLLPVLAVAILAAVVLWPEIARQIDRERLRAAALIPRIRTGQLADVTYHGVDERNRPYTVTATQATETAPSRVDLVNPKGDVLLESGRWLYVKARQGVYIQHAGNLDLSQDVELYRDDGTTLQTNSTNVDLKSGFASGTEQVHVEGPFGTIDAQGFSMSDRGTVLNFAGPGHLVLNARHGS